MAATQRLACVLRTRRLLLRRLRPLRGRRSGRRFAGACSAGRQTEAHAKAAAPKACQGGGTPNWKRSARRIVPQVGTITRKANNSAAGLLPLPNRRRLPLWLRRRTRPANCSRAGRLPPPRPSKRHTGQLTACWMQNR